MGLSMWLYRKIEISNSDKEPKDRITVNIPKGSAIQIDVANIASIEEEAGSWRKATYIHQWVVNNVQDGKDNCRRTYVSREKLKKLLDVCIIVNGLLKCPRENIEVVAGLLGGTSYDQKYIKDVKSTIKILEAALTKNNCDYYYDSDW